MKLYTHFTDAQRKMRRRQNQTANQTGFHRENTVLIYKLERTNNALINMEQMDMTDKEQITMLMPTLEYFTRQFGSTEAKLNRVIV